MSGGCTLTAPHTPSFCGHRQLIYICRIIRFSATSKTEVRCEAFENKMLQKIVRGIPVSRVWSRHVSDIQQAGLYLSQEAIFISFPFIVGSSYINVSCHVTRSNACGQLRNQRPNQTGLTRESVIRRVPRESIWQPFEYWEGLLNCLLRLCYRTSGFQECWGRVSGLSMDRICFWLSLTWFSYWFVRHDESWTNCSASVRCYRNGMALMFYGRPLWSMNIMLIIIKFRFSASH